MEGDYKEDSVSDNTNNITPDRTPEEATLIMRLHMFCRMRWFAIIGIIIATVVSHYSIRKDSISLHNLWCHCHL